MATTQSFDYDMGTDIIVILCSSLLAYYKKILFLLTSKIGILTMMKKTNMTNMDDHCPWTLAAVTTILLSMKMENKRKQKNSSSLGSCCWWLLSVSVPLSLFNGLKPARVHFICKMKKGNNNTSAVMISEKEVQT